MFANVILTALGESFVFKFLVKAKINCFYNVKSAEDVCRLRKIFLQGSNLATVLVGNGDFCDANVIVLL